MWLAKRQTWTSRSTTEAEVGALAESLFHEALPALDMWETILDRKVDLAIHEDNQACIKVAQKGCPNKLRHLTRTHKIDLSSNKELLDDGAFSIQYINTEDQAADIFTKGLPVHTGDHALALLGIKRLSADELRSPVDGTRSSSRL